MDVCLELVNAISMEVFFQAINAMMLSVINAKATSSFVRRKLFATIVDSLAIPKGTVELKDKNRFNRNSDSNLHGR